MFNDDVRKEMYKSKSSLKCICGNIDLNAEIVFDGVTKFGYELIIVCNECGRVHGIARLNTDSSNVIEVKRKVNIKED